MQFEGKRRLTGEVQLIAMKVHKEMKVVGDLGNGGFQYEHNVYSEFIPGTEHPTLYTFWRKPRGTFGQWVVFMYNGDEHVPDLSVPISLEQLPRDAEKVGDQAALRYWLTNDSNPPAPRGICFRREDAHLEKLAKLGIVREEEKIPGTDLYPLYTYDYAAKKDWHKEIPLSGTITSFEVLPPGSERIPDQAALRCWFGV